MKIIFDTIIFNILANILSSALLGLFAYYFGFKPINRRLDKLNLKKIDYNSSAIDLLYKTYTQSIEETKVEIQKITNQIEEIEENSNPNKSEEEYWLEIDFLNNLKEERRLLKLELEGRIIELTELLKTS